PPLVQVALHDGMPSPLAGFPLDLEELLPARRGGAGSPPHAAVRSRDDAARPRRSSRPPAHTETTTTRRPTTATLSAIGPPRALSRRWIDACHASAMVDRSAPANAGAALLLRSTSAHPVVISTPRTPT